MWLRSGGDTGVANNFLSFPEDTLAKPENKTASLVW